MPLFVHCEIKHYKSNSFFFQKQIIRPLISLIIAAPLPQCPQRHLPAAALCTMPQQMAAWLFLLPFIVAPSWAYFWLCGNLSRLLLAFHTALH